MRCFAFTNIGLEEFVSLEIKDILGVDSVTDGQIILFDSNTNNICKFSYLSQSIKRAGISLIPFTNFLKFEDIKPFISKLDLTKFISKDCSFAVKVHSVEDIDIKGLESDIGAFIFRNLESQGINLNVNLSNPDILFFVHIIGKKFFLGIDLVGFDIDKRDYKVFPNHLDIRGNIAYSMLRFAGYNGRGNLLDPFCKSSTIPIEAALLSSGISHNFFRKDSFAFLRAPFLQKQDFKNFFSDVDSESKNFKSEIFAFDSLLKNIHASRKNAKIANINKRISFSKTPLENLDLKFDSDIDFIVSVPTLTNSFNHKSVSKEYNELFHQADLVLSAEGSLVLLILDPSLLKGLVQNYSLVLSNELVIMTGKQTSHMLLFNKR